MCNTTDCNRSCILDRSWSCESNWQDRQQEMQRVDHGNTLNLNAVSCWKADDSSGFVHSLSSCTKERSLILAWCCHKRENTSAVLDDGEARFINKCRVPSLYVLAQFQGFFLSLAAIESLFCNDFIQHVLANRIPVAANYRALSLKRRRAILSIDCSFQDSVPACRS